MPAQQKRSSFHSSQRLPVGRWRSIRSIKPDTFHAITSAAQAAQNQLPWPPRPPEWQGDDLCQQTLQAEITSLLWALDNNASPQGIKNALNQLISDFSPGPSRFLQITRQWLSII